MTKTKTAKVAASLVPVTATDVETWLRNAWPAPKVYPNGASNRRLATRINVIVERQNARSCPTFTTDGSTRQRDLYDWLKKHAQSFIKRSHLIDQELRFYCEMLIVNQKSAMRYEDLTKHISALENAVIAVQALLERYPALNADDHQHPVLWIAEAVQRTWEETDRTSDKTKINFGHKSSDPLATFIDLVLGRMGWVWNGSRAEDHLEAISDRLRGRQNRPRSMRGQTRS